MTDAIPCCPQLYGKLQQVPLVFSPPAATFQENWSVPRCAAYVTVPMKSPSSCRTPRLYCVVLGILYSLSISQISRSPNCDTSGLSTDWSAVRYDGLNATCPATGATPCGANRIVYVGFVIFSFSSTATSNGMRS